MQPPYATIDTGVGAASPESNIELENWINHRGGTVIMDGHQIGECAMTRWMIRFPAASLEEDSAGK